METKQLRFMCGLVLGLLVGLAIIIASCSSITAAYMTPTYATTQYQSSTYGYSINIRLT
jgi:hypothetical protein